MGAGLVGRARELPAWSGARASELASIDEFLERIEAGPAALVLSGEAGIGKKTALVERALGRGARVLSVRSAESGQRRATP